MGPACCTCQGITCDVFLCVMGFLYFPDREGRVRRVLAPQRQGSVPACQSDVRRRAGPCSQQCLFHHQPRRKGNMIVSEGCVWYVWWWLWFIHHEGVKFSKICTRTWGAERADLKTLSRWRKKLSFLFFSSICLGIFYPWGQKHLRDWMFGLVFPQNRKTQYSIDTI